MKNFKDLQLRAAMYHVQKYVYFAHEFSNEGEGETNNQVGGRIFHC